MIPRQCVLEMISLHLWTTHGEGNGTPLQYSCLENPWIEEPSRLQSMGSLRVGHDWATSLSFFTFMHWRRKWQPTPVFLPGESQGRGSHLWGRKESSEEFLSLVCLEWVAISSSRGSSQPRDWPCFSCITSRFFTDWAIREAWLRQYHLPKVVAASNSCPKLNRLPNPFTCASPLREYSQAAEVENHCLRTSIYYVFIWNSKFYLFQLGWIQQS